MRVRGIICLSVISAIFVPLCGLAQNNNTETLTFTTYYPAPYGVYGVLKLNPRTKPAVCSEGEITYDNTTNTTARGLYYCNSTLAWDKLSGGVGGKSFWAENLTTHNIYNNNTGGKVGIGTANPAGKLSVQGGALGTLFGDTLAIQELDSNVTNNQSLRTFTRRIAAGNTWTTADLYMQRSIDGTDMGFIKWPANDAGIGFGSNTTEHIRITPAGSVGIRTATPSQRLEVVGNIRVSGTTPTSLDGNINVVGDVCNDAGKCLSQVPPCPCGNTVVTGTTCPSGTVPFMYHYDSGTGGFISCASHKLTCSVGGYGTATVAPSWGTSTACVDIYVNCNYCDQPYVAHICGGGPVETACKRP